MAGNVFLKVSGSGHFNFAGLYNCSCSRKNVTIGFHPDNKLFAGMEALLCSGVATRITTKE
jgi:hypothetical protein